MKARARMRSFGRAGIALFALAILLSVALQVAAPQDQGSPLQITDIDFPAKIQANGNPVAGLIFFQDPDGDVVKAKFELVEGDQSSLQLNPGWEFDPGVKGQTEGVIEFQIAATAGGSFKLQVVLEDEAGNQSEPLEFGFEAIALNRPPVAKFTYVPTEVHVGEVVTFDASGSYDPDGSIQSYDWDFGDGATGSGRVVTHVYNTAGSYTVTLRVTDDRGASASTSKRVELRPSYTVCTSGCPFTEIQAAIDSAESGETITIGPGTYEENLTITKSLILKGAGRDRTEIKGKAAGEPVIKIESDSEIEVTIDGLMIAEAKVSHVWSADANGIWISGKAIMIIRNSLISGNGNEGIVMLGSSRATISDSEISGNGEDGIVMVGSSQAEISGSTISGNDWEGIVMDESSQVTISGSQISGNGGDGIDMGDSSRATISNSEISGNGNGIVMVGSSQAEISGSTISGNDWEGIHMGDPSQAVIRGNRIFENKRYGVALDLKRCGFEYGEESFEGKLEGSGNEIHDNGKGDVCPSELEFLTTSQGGCYGPKC